MKRRLIEAKQIEAIGGLAPWERAQPGIYEMVELAVPVVAKFKEALQRGGVKDWWQRTQAACMALREANAESTLGFLLRKGVQTVANSYYTLQPANWRQYCDVVPSNAVAEWYTPLYGSAVALPVNENDQFQEAPIIGENLSLRNAKYGRIENFSRELFDDDQTGQIKQRAERLGQSVAVTESVWSAGRLLGAAYTYGPLSVPASNYATTDINGTAISTPFSATMYGSASGNQLQTLIPVGMGSLKAAYVQAKNAVDPNNNKIIVDVNTLVVSTQDIINAAMLLRKGPYPATPGQSNVSLATRAVQGGTVSAVGANQGVLAGFPGGVFADNVFGDMGIKQVTEVYLKDWAWLLGQGGKGLIFQERDPMEIVQETPNSGFSFSFDAIRFRSRRRFEVDWIASRFWVLGNDGSVSGVQ